MDAPDEPTPKPAPKSRKATARKSAVKQEHIYIVTSPEMRAAGKYKLGYHTGSREKLVSRYVTALNEVEVVLFMEGTLEEEQAIHDRLAAYRVNNVRGNASEWYTLPVRTLILKAMKVLASFTSVKAGDSEAAEEAPKPPKYVGPSKFLDACKDKRWDLIQEWLNSREYKQDKHRKSKLNRKSDAGLIPWNEAHHWLECLTLMCANGNSVELLEVLIRFCEGRWVDRGAWVTQEDALRRGRDAAIEAKNTLIMGYFEKNWVLAEKEEASAPTPNTEPAPSEPQVTPVQALGARLELLTTRVKWDLDRLVDSLRAGEFERVIPHVCDAILRDDADTRMALTQLLVPTQFAAVALYAASRSWNSVVEKTLGYGLSAAQCARVATSLGDVRALECLVMNFGASWPLYTRETVLHYVNTRSTAMIEEFAKRGVTNWENALVAAAEFGAPELIPRFLGSARPEKRRAAIQRAILNNHVEVVDILGPYVNIHPGDIQLAKSDEVRQILQKHLMYKTSSVEEPLPDNAFASARYS